MTSKFNELGIKPELVSALIKLSITEPTPIQVAAIPVLLSKKDVYLQAETGTGKTLAYLLPLYSMIDPKIKNAQLIVVAPTHELAIQIQRQCTELTQQSGLPVRTILLIGGTSLDRQLEKLKKKPHIVIGSPGKIRELIGSRKLKVHMVNTVVIDEADRMLGAERSSDLESIVKSVAIDRNLVFVSATEHRAATEAVDRISPDVIRINVATAAVSADIEHLYLVCEARDRAEFIRKLISAMTPEKSIVFVHKNFDAEIIAKKLSHHNMKVVDLHGALEKGDRKKAMDDIRNGKVDILIASDLAARGLDIKGVSHIFNFDVPSDSGDYLHRVGRTGRAGLKGIAVTLISQDQMRLIERFRKDLDITITETTLRGGNLYAMD